MEEDYLHIAKTNIRPEPYDLLRKVFDEKGYEATTRVFIDALVTRITQHNMLQFSMKKPYKLYQEQRQTEKTEYIIKDINGPIGVVGVEPAKSLIKASIMQCMEQLIAIQQEIEEKGCDIFPLFGIVTDALHFIFIKLHPDGQFEFEKDDKNEMKVHRAYTWAKFHEITEIFNGLCQLHKKFVSTDSPM